MNCEKCQTPLKTKGFRWTRRIVCKKCGAEYIEQRTVVDSKTNRIFELSLWILFALNIFLSNYWEDKLTSLESLGWTLINFAILLTVTCKSYTFQVLKEYRLVANNDHPLAKQDELILGTMAFLVIGGFCIMIATL